MGAFMTPACWVFLSASLAFYAVAFSVLWHGFPREQYERRQP